MLGEGKKKYKKQKGKGIGTVLSTIAPKKKSYKKKILGKGIKKITRPYINKENKLMLGEGKKKYKKQKGKGIGTVLSTIAPYALNLLKNIFT